jgi:hypothetical protein
MSAFLALFSTFWARFAGSLGKLALWTGTLAFLGPLAPIFGGIAQAIGSIITAIAEILASLSKSAEGRVALCLLAAGIGFLYLRFHYIEEGKTQARAKMIAMQKPCPALPIERRRR